MTEEIQFYPINKILLPTDGSNFSLKAAKYAAKIAKKHDSKVTLLHVMDLHFPRARAREPIEFDDLGSATIEIEHEKDIKKRAINIIEKTKKFLIQENITFDTQYFLFGNIPEIIVKTAKEENFDLIIIGHKGLSGVRHIMLGSVAERVCRSAPCPVLIIR
jgi:nucleotide-binding universal stress UspA family protein